MFIDENAYFWILLKFLASWNDMGARYDPNMFIDENALIANRWANF